MDPLSATLGSVMSLFGDQATDAGDGSQTPGPTATSDASIHAGTRSRMGRQDVKVKIETDTKNPKGATAVQPADPSAVSPWVFVVAIVAVIVLLILALVLGG